MLEDVNGRIITPAGVDLFVLFVSALPNRSDKTRLYFGRVEEMPGRLY